MDILDDLQKQATIDKDNLYHKMINLPEQILNAYQKPEIIRGQFSGVKGPGTVKRVVTCGMGGSAVAGDIAVSAFGTKMPFSSVKDYKIPFLNQDTLVIILSYSGNTAEALECLQQAIARTEHIAAVTSGGKLAELVKKRYNWVRIPSGYPPRAAIGYLFFSLMRLLEIFAVIPDHSATIPRIVANLVKKASAIANSVPAARNLAKSTALEIFGKIPIIYAEDPQLLPLAYRWKSQINENAKYPAFCHFVPEMNHNEIEGWESDKYVSSFIPIFLRRLEQQEEYSKRIHAFRNLIADWGIESLDFFTEGDKLIEKIFSLIYLGDMVSYYLALLQNIDPGEIRFIRELKKSIEKK
ncbi:MAG: bifunctional phosphoglucose/phosphomannose isomerase [Candidatus Cloacimonetes bacterium]|nr:bifunctional phosphoglucose/phosphomannose isomerase [Candidatus Cloacimonadota bacterium]